MRIKYSINQGGDNMYDAGMNVIDAINSIDTITMESTIDVYNALSSEYDKLMSLIDYDVDNIYQEGEVWDIASGKYSTDNILMKIIKFLPRLVMGIIDAVGNTFNKNYDKDLNAVTLKAKDNLNNLSDTEIDEASKQIGNNTKGQIKLDKQKKQFSLFGTVKSVWNKGTLLMSSAHILRRIKTEINNPNTDYRKFANEISDVFQKNKDIDEETISVSIDAFKQGLEDLGSGSIAVSSACKEISDILTKKCEEELKKGNNSKAQDIKSLVDQMQAISTMIAKTSLTGRLGFKVLSFLGSPLAFTKKGRTKYSTGAEKFASNKMERVLYSDDYDEIEDLDRDIKSAERSSRSKVRQNKKEAKLHKAKQARRQRLSDAEKANKAATDRLEADRLTREMEDDIYKQTRNTEKND